MTGPGLTEPAPTHPITTETPGPGRAEVKLANGRTLDNRDATATTTGSYYDFKRARMGGSVHRERLARPNRETR